MTSDPVEARKRAALRRLNSRRGELRADLAHIEREIEQLEGRPAKRRPATGGRRKAGG